MIVAALFAATASAATGYAIALLYPHMLFEHHTRIGQIDVPSEQPIDSELSRAIEEATSIISESALYDPESNLCVILANSHVYHRLLLGKELA